MSLEEGRYPASLRELCHAAAELRATDLHISRGLPPLVRIDGRIQPLELPVLGAAQSRWLCYGIMTDRQQRRLEEDLEVDFAFGLDGGGRFRANVFNQRGATAGAFRTIPQVIPTFDDLGLPPMLHSLCVKPRGLVLVTGATGSGKSTTLAAMIDRINATEPCTSSPSKIPLSTCIPPSVRW